MMTYSDSITNLNVTLIPTRMVSESLGVSFDVILPECAFEITLFQLGLSRVVTWPGSRFEKERI